MNLDPIVLTMVKAGWLGMLLGVVSGAVIGLFFHREDWMGGYASYRRRLTRLGHISFFGLALVNFSFAFTQHVLALSAPWNSVAMWAFLVGAVSMPACCFLSAWRKPFRHFFFIPVGSVLLGVICVLFVR
jgi:hypothetical protein